MPATAMMAHPDRISPRSAVPPPASARAAVGASAPAPSRTFRQVVKPATSPARGPRASDGSGARGDRKVATRSGAGTGADGAAAHDGADQEILFQKFFKSV